MKHFLLSILLIIPCVIYAHKINGYKYLTIESQGNPYKIESKINNFFKGIGFKVISMDDFITFVSNWFLLDPKMNNCFGTFSVDEGNKDLDDIRNEIESDLNE